MLDENQGPPVQSHHRQTGPPHLQHGTKGKEVTAQTTTTKANKALQTCPCGWNKITSEKGLKIHQGKKRWLIEGELGTRIDHYFLRSSASQSSEVQRLESNQSSQDISPPVSEVGCTSTGKELEDGVQPTQQQMPTRERRQQENKPRVNWPGTAEKTDQNWERDPVPEDQSSLWQSFMGKEIWRATKKTERDMQSGVFVQTGVKVCGCIWWCVHHFMWMLPCLISTADHRRRNDRESWQMWQWITSG